MSNLQSFPGLDRIREDLNQRSLGGFFEGIILFASGVPRKLLRYVPEEKTEFLVQGTGVLVAASVAGLATFFASSVIIEPAPDIPSRLIAAAIAFALIFTVDRTLVRSSLVPHRFSPEVLNSIWDPFADKQWYEVMSRASSAPSLWRRVRDFFSLGVKISIRLLLAALISWMVADVAALAVFRSVIDDRAGQMLTAIREERETAIAAVYDAELNRIEDARDLLEAGIEEDSAVAAIRDDIEDLENELGDAVQDREVYRRVANAEIAGTPGISGILSSGEVWPSEEGTSGVPECGPLCEDNLELAGQLDSRIDGLREELDTLRAGYRTALDTAEPSGSLERLDEEEDAAVDRQARDLQELDDFSTEPEGILIRRAALEQLVADRTPWTDALDEQECDGSWAWACGAANTVFPTTPMGSFVSAFRWTVFLIDILPITLKAYYSLRARRPYEVLLAALEEASVGGSLNSLDQQLNVVGEQMESRGASRRAARGANGARLVRERREASRRERAQIEKEFIDRMRGVPEGGATDPKDFVGWLKAKRDGFRPPKRIVMLIDELADDDASPRSLEDAEREHRGRGFS